MQVGTKTIHLLNKFDMNSLITIIFNSNLGRVGEPCQILVALFNVSSVSSLKYLTSLDFKNRDERKKKRKNITNQKHIYIYDHAYFINQENMIKSYAGKIGKMEVSC